MSLIQQPASVPLSFVEVGGKRLPTFINPPWQKTLGPQLTGSISDMDARLDALEALVAGLGDGSHVALATLDFGASFTDKAQTVVTGQTWVEATSAITASVMCPAGVDTDEIRLLDMRAVISDLVAGVGFTVTLYSEPEARGTYVVSCVGV